MSSNIVNISGYINDAPSDYDYLFSLCDRLCGIKDSEVIFDFTYCRFLRQNAVVVLGALIRVLQQNGNVVAFQLDTIENRVRVNLEQNGFLHRLGLGGFPWNGNSIPYREDRFMVEDDYADYLSEKWLGKGWINVSANLRDHIVSRVIEAYINVFDHAASPIGVITCGQHYPFRHELRITMADMGVGIPNTVREYLKQPQMSAADALRWAFEPMKTTKDQNNFARGNGLKLLKSFMEDNHGKLEIYSETGYACIDDKGNHFENRQRSFQGTIVQITLICDAARYTLPEEDDHNSDEWFF
ncbi:MAG: ATP-binding protein [Chloroflexi bacterium]|nr:ATP-binding protein [Chloroflexota bacterium]